MNTAWPSAVQKQSHGLRWSTQPLLKQRTPFYNWENWGSKTQEDDLPKICKEAKIPVKNSDSKICLSHNFLFFLLPWRHREMSRPSRNTDPVLLPWAPQVALGRAFLHQSSGPEARFSHLTLSPQGSCKVKSKGKWDKYMELDFWAVHSRKGGILHNFTSEEWIPYTDTGNDVSQLRWSFKDRQEALVSMGPYVPEFLDF